MIRKLFFLLIYTLQLHKACRLLFRRKILILYFHNIVSPEGSWFETSNNSLTEDVFLKQMRYLKKYYHILSLDECVAILEKKKKIKPYSVVLTFDDGYANHYRYVFPALKKLGLPATFFINSSYINTQRLFWWDEKKHKELANQYVCMTSAMIKEMQGHGMQIGGHTANHTILAREKYEDQKMEIEQSKKFLDGSRPLHFCYPNGLTGDFNEETKKIVKETGFRSASSAIAGFCDHKTDLYELRRMIGCPNFIEFVCSISGIKLLLKPLRKFIKK